MINTEPNEVAEGNPQPEQNMENEENPNNQENVGPNEEENMIETNDNQDGQVQILKQTRGLGEDPIEMDCPICDQHIITSIDSVASLLPYVLIPIFVLLSLFSYELSILCPIYLFFISCSYYCVHYCPVCGYYIGNGKAPSKKCRFIHFISRCFSNCRSRIRNAFNF